MDPIGFALENFDWTGRWRDKEFDGSADRYDRRAALGRKVRRSRGTAAGAAGQEGRFFAAPDRKVLGYALGRSLQDGDSCTVQRMADALRKDDYRARTLIREVVLSVPFRNSQGGVVSMESAPPPGSGSARWW